MFIGRTVLARRVQRVVNVVGRVAYCELADVDLRYMIDGLQV